MEIIFLQTIELISDNRMWLGPLMAAVLLIAVMREIILTFKDIQKEMEE